MDLLNNKYFLMGSLLLFMLHSSASLWNMMSFLHLYHPQFKDNEINMHYPFQQIHLGICKQERHLIKEFQYVMDLVT